MFSELGPAARAVVTLAEQECRNASHYFLGTEHILLAMAIAPPPDVMRFFASAGLQQWQVKRSLREAMRTHFEHCWQGVIVTQRTRRIFDMAKARKPGAAVEAIDLLDAIIADGGGVAARVLASLRPAAVRHGAP